MGFETVIGMPFSFMKRSIFASMWSSPRPDTRVSPVSSEIFTLIVGSSFERILRMSMIFERSLMFFISIDLVTTGSNMCFMSSNGGISWDAPLSVSPEDAWSRPVTATMFPTHISFTGILFGPSYTDTCWTRVSACTVER